MRPKQLILLLFLTAFQSSFGQQSIFQKDTVNFVYKYYHHSDEHRKTESLFIGDSILIQKIKIDDKKNVYWELQKRNYHNLLPEAMAFDREEELLDSLPDIYVFKAGIEHNTIVYRDAKIPRKVLFKAPLNSKEKTGKLPFFINEAYIGILENTKEDYIYRSDTLIIVGKRNVPCYLFTSVAFNESVPQSTLEFTYSELYVEKASLLPIYRTIKQLGRYRYRTDGKFGTANDRNTANSRYELGYKFGIIEPVPSR